MRAVVKRHRRLGRDLEALPVEGADARDVAIGVEDERHAAHTARLGDEVGEHEGPGGARRICARTRLPVASGWAYDPRTRAA